jgi:hypothetical protein
MPKNRTTQAVLRATSPFGRFLDQLLKTGSHPRYPQGTPVVPVPDDDLRRPDGTLKGSGFFGALLRPDGGVMSEYSVANSEQLRGPKGEYLDYPSLVPTLTAEEVMSILADKPLSPAILQKAEAFALQRQRAGRPIFADPGEEDIQQYPQLRRAIAIPMRSAR